MTEKGLLESIDRIRVPQRVNNIRIITLVSVIKTYTPLVIAQPTCLSIPILPIVFTLQRQKP